VITIIDVCALRNQLPRRSAEATKFLRPLVVRRIVPFRLIRIGFWNRTIFCAHVSFRCQPLGPCSILPPFSSADSASPKRSLLTARSWRSSERRSAATFPSSRTIASSSPELGRVFIGHQRSWIRAPSRVVMGDRNFKSRRNLSMLDSASNTLRKAIGRAESSSGERKRARALFQKVVLGKSSLHQVCQRERVLRETSNNRWSSLKPLGVGP